MEDDKSLTSHLREKKRHSPLVHSCCLDRALNLPPRHVFRSSLKVKLFCNASCYCLDQSALQHIASQILYYCLTHASWYITLLTAISTQAQPIPTGGLTEEVAVLVVFSVIQLIESLVPMVTLYNCQLVTEYIYFPSDQRSSRGCQLVSMPENLGH